MNSDKIMNFLFKITNNIVTSPQIKNYEHIIINDKKDNDEYDGYIKNILSDSFNVLIIGSICFLSYVYLANEFICQIIGLYYPIYFYHKQFINELSDEFFQFKNVFDKKMDMMIKKNNTLNYFIKYLFLYSHIEFISYPIRLFFISFFYHIKIIILFLLVYILINKKDILNLLYEKIILVDKYIVNIIENKIYDFKFFLTEKNNA